LKKAVRELMLQHGKNSAQGLVDMLPAGSEPWADVASRALASVGQWLDRHPGGEILFVCHDAVMQSMAQRLTGKFFKNGHGRPFRYVRTAEVWTVEEVGS
jgi:broad specificity phosphatase PhoE